MEEKIYIGIDPGKLGFLCILAPNEEPEFIALQDDPKKISISGTLEGL